MRVGAVVTKVQGKRGVDCCWPAAFVQQRCTGRVAPSSQELRCDHDSGVVEASGRALIRTSFGGKRGGVACKYGQR